MGKIVRFLPSIKNVAGFYNVTYGVDDFNAVISCLTGSGVAPFPSKSTYSAEELNALTEALAEGGVSLLDGLRVSISDGVISIAQGIGYFTNGATIEVDNEGVDFENSISGTSYIYAEYDANIFVCDFCQGENLPQETDTVFIIPLACLNADGTVTDLRRFAQSKIASAGANKFKMLYEVTSGKESIANEVLYEGNIGGFLDCHHLIVVYKSGNSTFYERIPLIILDEEDISLFPLGSDKHIYVNLKGSVLKIYAERTGSVNFNAHAGTEMYLC